MKRENERKREGERKREKEREREREREREKKFLVIATIQKLNRTIRQMIFKCQRQKKNTSAGKERGTETSPSFWNKSLLA